MNKFSSKLTIVAIVAVSVFSFGAVYLPTNEVAAKPQPWTLGKCYERKPTLSISTNTTHPCVLHLQQLLKYGGFQPGPRDGVFGQKTKGAVIRFQARFRLTQDGTVGPRTWTKLQNKIGFMD